MRERWREKRRRAERVRWSQEGAKRRERKNGEGSWTWSTYVGVRDGERGPWGKREGGREAGEECLRVCMLRRIIRVGE